MPPCRVPQSRAHLLLIIAGRRHDRPELFIVNARGVLSGSPRRARCRPEAAPPAAPPPPGARPRRRPVRTPATATNTRRRTHGDGKPEPVGRASAPAGIDERHVRRGQREEPEQLVPADLRELPQRLQLLVREHLGRQPAPPRQSLKIPSSGAYRRISARFSAVTTATPGWGQDLVCLG
jgi:hypothetical protein